jgi:hypothetical protein
MKDLDTKEVSRVNGGYSARDLRQDVADYLRELADWIRE